MQNVTKRKNKDGHNPAQAKRAKCGHISLSGRYFKCETCLPELPEDTGDWVYFGDENESDE